MKSLLKIVLCACMTASLSGCIAAAVGAGAAGGAYIEKHYNVDFTVKKKKPEQTNTSNTEAATQATSN